MIHLLILLAHAVWVGVLTAWLVWFCRDAWRTSTEGRITVFVEGTALHMVEAGRLVFYPMVFHPPQNAPAPREVQ